MAIRRSLTQGWQTRKCRSKLLWNSYWSTLASSNGRKKTRKTTTTTNLHRITYLTWWTQTRRWSGAKLCRSGIAWSARTTSNAPSAWRASKRWCALESPSVGTSSAGPACFSISSLRSSETGRGAHFALIVSTPWTWRTLGSSKTISTSQAKWLHSTSWWGLSLAR